MTRSEQPGLPRFYVGDKVRHKGNWFTAEVVGLGQEVTWPNGVTARKVYIEGAAVPLDRAWAWDYELEAW